jgi:hypothetical protein
MNFKVEAAVGVRATGMERLLEQPLLLEDLVRARRKQLQYVSYGLAVRGSGFF